MHSKKNDNSIEIIIDSLILLSIIVFLLFSNNLNLYIGEGESDSTVQDLDSSLQRELDLAKSEDDDSILLPYNLDETSTKLNWIILDNVLNNKTNNFCSPYSIVRSLAVLESGASSDTKAELSKFLGVGSSKRYTLPSDVTISNSIWLQDSNLIPDLDNKFTNKAVINYETDVKIVDFTNDILDITEEMTSYVNTQTGGIINNYTPKITSKTKLSVLNTAGLDAIWYYNFNNLEKRKFKGTINNTTTDFMFNYGGKYKYLKRDDFIGIVIPYSNSLRMEIISTSKNSNTNVLSLLKEKDASYRNKFLDDLEKSKKVKFKQVGLPKVRIDSSNTELAYILEEKGLKHLFNTDAYFENISLDAEFYADYFDHRAILNLSELGENTIKGTTFIGKKLILDRPFYFVVKDTDRNLILFSGILNNIPEINY